MSHFAQINESNIVIRVLVGDNDDPNGDEGKKWFEDNYGGTWVQTSFSGSFRGKFACMGMKYDPSIDEFVYVESKKDDEIG